MLDKRRDKVITYNKLKEKFPGITLQEAIKKAAEGYLPCPVCNNKNPGKTAVYVDKKAGENVLDSPLIIKCGECGADLSFEKGETESPLTSEKIAEILTSESSKES